MGDRGLYLLNLWGEFGLNCGGLIGEKFPLNNIILEGLGDLSEWCDNPGDCCLILLGGENLCPSGLTLPGNLCL